MNILIHCQTYTDNTESITLNINRLIQRLGKKHNIKIISKDNQFKIPIIGHFLYLLKTRNLIKKLNPDVILEYEVTGIPLITDIPVITYGRGLDVFNLTWFSKLSIENSEIFVALSNYMEEFVRLNTNQTNREIIRNGIENDFALKDIVQENDRYLYVGRLIKEKNLKIMIEYFVNNRKSINSKLIIVGYGPESVELKKYVKVMGLNDVIKFTGKLSRELVKEQYAKAEFFLMLSNHPEGCNNSILEALASGCKLITNNKYGNNENKKIGLEHNLDMIAEDIEELCKGVTNV